MTNYKKITQKFDIKISQKILILLIAVCIVVIISIVFLGISRTQPAMTQIQFIIFFIVLLIAVIIIYKTIKHISFKFDVDVDFRD